MNIALFLVKAGYYGGNIDTVYNSSVDGVLETYHYEIFSREVETTFNELNKSKG